MKKGQLQIWCYSYRLAITSDMPADPVSLRYACLYSATLSDMHAEFIYQIHVFVKCFSIKQDIWSITNPPDMPTG